MRTTVLKGFAYVIAVLAFQEAILRVFFPLPELSNFDRGMYTVVDEAKVNGFVRNRAYFWESSVDTSHRFNHYYNRYGFRDKEWRVNRNSNQTRILFVGDSYVESVMSDSTLTQYFKAMNPNELEVMNAGMLGTGISRYLRLFTDMAPIFRPDVVVMVVYANDFMYDEVQLPTHYLSEEYYDEWKPRVVELFQQWQRGAPVPFRLSTVVKPLFSKAGEEGFSWNTQLQEMNNHATADLVKAMQEGTFNHHRLNEFIREERYLRKRRNLLVPMDYLSYYSDKFDFLPIVVYVPSRNQITDNYLQYEHEMCLSCDRSLSLTDSVYNQNQFLLGKSCEKVGIPFFNLSDFVQNHEQNGNSMYWNYDGHLNERGTRLIAHEIYRKYSSLKRN